VVVGYHEGEDGENVLSANFVMSATLRYKPGLTEGERAPKQLELHGSNREFHQPRSTLISLASQQE
jgi:hypothetical protein